MKPFIFVFIFIFFQNCLISASWQLRPLEASWQLRPLEASLLLPSNLGMTVVASSTDTRDSDDFSVGSDLSDISDEETFWNQRAESFHHVEPSLKPEEICKELDDIINKGLHHDMQALPKNYKITDIDAYALQLRNMHKGQLPLSKNMKLAIVHYLKNNELRSVEPIMNVWHQVVAEKNLYGISVAQIEISLQNTEIDDKKQ